MAPVSSRVTTTREDFGTALAVLARLYQAAEDSGDLSRAERYLAAVQLVLGAWPSEDLPDAPPCSSAETGSRSWPEIEPTKIGLGTLPPTTH
jgi:hypothetical protein